MLFHFRFLASGNDFKAMHTNYYRGASTIAKIVRTVCRAIWKHLSSQNIPPITKQLLEDVAIEFDKKANFPNCIGALDGKHIRISCPAHSGSLFYNYKGYNSIVLLAIVDSRYRFIFVDIGAYGKESDSTIFHNSKLYDLIVTHKLPIPAPKPLPCNQNAPFVFVGDEAFSLSNNVMRPYSGKHLSVEQRIFNYRLSRARRYVECAFGIMANKWRILHRAINVKYEFATDIIKACCVLHNFVLNRDGVQASDDNIFNDSNLQMLQSVTTNESSMGPHLTRNIFCNYFSSDVGALSWQLKKI